LRIRTWATEALIAAVIKEVQEECWINCIRHEQLWREFENDHVHPMVCQKPLCPSQDLQLMTLNIEFE
jgi:hypothetical protein